MVVALAARGPTPRMKWDKCSQERSGTPEAQNVGVASAWTRRRASQSQEQRQEAGGGWRVWDARPDSVGTGAAGLEVMAGHQS